MQPTATLNPTADQTFELVGEGPYDFARTLAHSRTLERRGEVEQACNTRFQAVQRLTELLPEEEETILEWNHPNSRAALELLHASAVDHFLVDDFELSAALLEQLLELDPEDHLEASELLCFNYLALDEGELFDDTLADVPDSAARSLLLLWAGVLRDGALPADELHRLRTRFAPVFAEFTAAEHPADETYLRDIEGERPSPAAQARELWLRTENLWQRWPALVEALRTAGR